MMLVRLGEPGRGGKRLLSDLAFLAITVAPWVILLWLMWPRR